MDFNDVIGKGFFWDRKGNHTSVLIVKCHRAIHTCACFSVQESWVKTNLPIAELLNHQGSRAIRMIEEMERVAPNRKLTGHNFKVLQGISVPEDFHSIVTAMIDSTQKPTTDRLRQVATEIKQARWWEWMLQHPQLTDKYIHPSRSMCPHPSSLIVFSY